MKFFRRSLIRSNVAVESFFLPHSSRFRSARLISRAVNDFKERINSVNDQNFVFSCEASFFGQG